MAKWDYKRLTEYYCTSLEKCNKRDTVKELHVASKKTQKSNVCMLMWEALETWQGFVNARHQIDNIGAE